MPPIDLALAFQLVENDAPASRHCVKAMTAALHPRRRTSALKDANRLRPRRVNFPEPARRGKGALRRF